MMHIIYNGRFLFAKIYEMREESYAVYLGEVSYYHGNLSLFALS